MRRLLALLTLVVGFSWLLAPSASACSCEALGVDEAAEAADVVAHVRVVEVNAADDATHVFADVLRIWKGDTPPQIHVVSPAGEGQCGITPPSEGTQLLIYAVDQHLSYRVDLCSGTREYTAEDADVNRLGELLGDPVIRGPVDAPPEQDARQESEGPGFSWWVTGLSLGFLLAVGFVVYRYEQKHGKQRRRR